MAKDGADMVKGVDGGEMADKAAMAKDAVGGAGIDTGELVDKAEGMVKDAAADAIDKAGVVGDAAELKEKAEMAKDAVDAAK